MADYDHVYHRNAQFRGELVILSVCLPNGDRCSSLNISISSIHKVRVTALTTRWVSLLAIGITQVIYHALHFLAAFEAQTFYRFSLNFACRLTRSLRRQQRRPSYRAMVSQSF